MRAHVGESSFFAGIGIAIFAAVDTRVVFSNVFAFDAATELALSLIAVIAMGRIHIALQ
jgi:hypothetical protein